MRQVIGWLGACMLALPLAAQEPEALVAQLNDTDQSVRLKAIARLRGMGDAARPALEHYLMPRAVAKKKVEMTAALKARIDALIAQLDARKYRDREKASEELVKIGEPAAPALRAAAKGYLPEVATRASAILARIFPTPKKGQADERGRMEAALLLGDVGTRASVASLHHVLRGKQTGVALTECAAFALRAITGGGPRIVVLDHDKQRAAVLGNWKTYLETAKAPAGEAVELALRYDGKTALHVVEKTRFLMEMKTTPGGGPAPPGLAGMRFEGKIDSRFSTTVGMAPLAITRAYAKHAQEMVRKGGPAVGGGKGGDWTGKTLTLSFGKDDAAVAKLGGGDLKAGDLKGPLALGHTIALWLPRGKYAVGQRRALSASALRRLNATLFVTSNDKRELLDSVGSVRYLGRVGGVDRFYLTFRASRPEGAGLTNMTLQGPIDIDPARGVMRGHDLSGMLWQELELGGSKGRLIGEMHLGSTEGKPAEKKKDPEGEK